MNEDLIECLVQRKIDALDNRCLTGGMTEAEYKQAVRKIDAWSRQQTKVVIGRGTADRIQTAVNARRQARREA